ncbi:hypothetical protein LS482_04745 [Sinomicrobium kalidii]|uniref:hypothetical protein n=1 Tax=Sinomicrobium kalidii TaxID=2900738 RepID=UPI001E62381B|nr:hypothetical protein [Sinomicrobium kalidii]UGU17181.1 hypothetical protein LS482_04745 [Sinomicrobium kalidii]
MSSYLPEKVFTVCTHNAGSDYGKLLTNPDARGEFTVLFKSKGKPLLTEADKKLDGQFSCKTGWSSGVGTAAFGVGIMAGLAVAATVATVPVAGWVIGGLIAAFCIGSALFGMFKPKPTCSEMIGYQESSWLNPHPTVTFDGHAAVTKQSMIQCKEGGFLLPFISESEAAEAAAEIGSQNKNEIAVIGATGFISGMAMGFTGGTSGALGVGKSLLWGAGLSAVVLQPLLDAESWVLEETYNNEPNPYYNDMTDMVGPEMDVSDSIIEVVTPDAPAPTPLKDPLSDIVPGGEVASTWNAKSPRDRIKEVLRNLKEQKRNLLGVRGSERMIAGLNAQIAQVNNAITTANQINPNTGQPNGFSKASNPAAAEVFRNARNGVYGHQVRSIFTNSRGDGRGMNRGNNYQSARDTLRQSPTMQNRQNTLNQYQSNANNNRTNIRARGGMAGIGIVGLVLPFISNYMSEATLKMAADAAMEDMANGISITAKQH